MDKLQVGNSLAFAIAENAQALKGYQLLLSVAPPPHGAPCLLTVSLGLEKCLSHVLDNIPDLSAAALEITACISALRLAAQKLLAETGAGESLMALDRTKSRHPEWNLFARIGSAKCPTDLTMLYLGCKALIALHLQKRLPGSATKNAYEVLKQPALGSEAIATLLHGQGPDDYLGQGWPRDLSRTWREVLRIFSTGGDIPPPTPNQRQASQLLDLALHGTTAERAGARTDRKLSALQFQTTQSVIARGFEDDHIQAYLGVITTISGFSVDVAAEIPVATESGASWITCIDVEQGLLQIDYQSLFSEAALPCPGAIPSSFVLTKPLPELMTRGLKKRALARPEARTLKELFPDQTVPAHDKLIYPSRDSIGPTWARLRKTLVTHLREEGNNTLLACLASGNLTHIPRSKLFYASISNKELGTTLDNFYQQAGWGPASEVPPSTLSFGSRVVPTWRTMQAIDEDLKAKTTRAHPGKHASLETLLQYHGVFMKWAASRLVVLLALRESKAYEIHASSHEPHGHWILVNDKEVIGGLGAMPQPLTEVCAQIMRAIRAHCEALHRRFVTLGQGHSELARWAKQVSRHGNVPLLCLAQTEKHIRTLGTADILGSLPSAIKVAPDWGRKFMENQLRHEGMHSSEIDAFLRHTVPGQVPMCSTSIAHTGTQWRRINQAISNIAQQLWNTPLQGLAKA